MKMGHGWWKETKRMIDEASEKFWAKRGGKPESSWGDYGIKRGAFRGPEVSGKKPEPPGKHSSG